MKKIAISLFYIIKFNSVEASSFHETFDNPQSIKNWISGSFIKGQNPQWDIEKNGNNGILNQKSYATYAFFVNPSIKSKNGTLYVKFNIISGKEDPEAGLVWRFQDSQNYLYIRTNTLEKNLIFYRMHQGKKEIVKQAPILIKNDEWNTLKVNFYNENIQVFYNSKEILNLKDDLNLLPGAVGLWTTADSRVLFDDLNFEEP